MSYHSKFKDWKYTLKYTDPLTSEIIDDIVEGVKYHGFKAYPIYWITCDADAWIHTLSSHFNRGKINTFKRKIDENIDMSKDVREKLIKIYKILREEWNKLPYKVRHPKPIKWPDKIELPIIQNFFEKVTAKEFVSVQPMQYKPGDEENK